MTDYTMGRYARLWGINTAIEFNCGHCGNICLANDITIFHQIQSFWDALHPELSLLAEMIIAPEYIAKLSPSPSEAGLS